MPRVRAMRYRGTRLAAKGEEARGDEEEVRVPSLLHRPDRQHVGGGQAERDDEQRRPDGGDRGVDEVRAEVSRKDVLISPDGRHEADSWRDAGCLGLGLEGNPFLACFAATVASRLQTKSTILFSTFNSDSSAGGAYNLSYSIGLSRPYRSTPTPTERNRDRRSGSPPRSVRRGSGRRWQSRTLRRRPPIARAVRPPPRRRPERS